MLLSQLVLPGSLGSAVHATLILHTMGTTGTTSSLKTPLLPHCSALFLSHRSNGKKSLPNPAACLPVPCCPSVLCTPLP